jgi:hypothetical protein
MRSSPTASPISRHERAAMIAFRLTLRAALVAVAALLPVAAATGESETPRQSRPQQLAQACRTLCVEEFNACQRTCDSLTTRINCQAQCQTRLNLCTSTCP